MTGRVARAADERSGSALSAGRRKARAPGKTEVGPEALIIDTAE
jgi:hypothetical protein